MNMYMELSRDEIQESIPYAIICETMESSRWETGKRKRRWALTFTASEQSRCRELGKQARSWYLVKGVPDKVRMSPSTYSLWNRLGDFCYEL